MQFRKVALPPHRARGMTAISRGQQHPSPQIVEAPPKRLQAASISACSADMCCAAAEVAARSIALNRLTTASPAGVSCAPPPRLPPACVATTGLPKRHVHFLDQIPGALVGHLHISRRRRDRTEGGNRLQQLYLARSYATGGVEIDPQAERWHVGYRSPVPRSGCLSPAMPRHMLAWSKLTALITANTGWPGIRPSIAQD